jgi:hypothetical protein
MRNIDLERAADAALRDSTLLLLVDRLGGQIEFSEADYQALLARHGGRRGFELVIDVLDRPGRAPRVRATLAAKVPSAAAATSREDDRATADGSTAGRRGAPNPVERGSR